MNFIIRKQMENIISKGAQPGHPFEGNQYTEHLSAASEHKKNANDIEKRLSFAYSQGRGAEAQNQIDLHRFAQEAHLKAADAIKHGSKYAPVFSADAQVASARANQSTFGKAVFTKGAQTGHPFEGNQYTEAASELATRASQVAGMPYEGRNSTDNREGAHTQLARDHESMAERLAGGERVPRLGVASGKGEAVDKAIQAHLQAAALHRAAAATALLPRQQQEYGDGRYISQKMGHSDYLTDLATKASLKALAATVGAFS
jgi:hypothetical protein